MENDRTGLVGAGQMWMRKGWGRKRRRRGGGVEVRRLMKSARCLSPLADYSPRRCFNYTGALSASCTSSLRFVQPFSPTMNLQPPPSISLYLSRLFPSPSSPSLSPLSPLFSVDRNGGNTHAHADNTSPRTARSLGWLDKDVTKLVSLRRKLSKEVGC